MHCALPLPQEGILILVASEIPSLAEVVKEEPWMCPITAEGLPEGISIA